MAPWGGHGLGATKGTGEAIRMRPGWDFVAGVLGAEGRMWVLWPRSSPPHLPHLHVGTVHPMPVEPKWDPRRDAQHCDLLHGLPVNDGDETLLEQLVVHKGD